MNKIIAKTMEKRGIDLVSWHEINVPYYDKQTNIDAMVAELKHIKDTGMEITVLPDFDMDGVASGVCGFAGLSELGFRVNLFVPDASKGYGFDRETIDCLLQIYPNTQVIITCDVGITQLDAIAYCKDKGLKVLVTDHHTEGERSKADIIVDPDAVDSTYEHEICGAFVFYQVLQYYADMYCNYFVQDQIRRLRVFAGLGTVSDLMPLLYENRAVVRDAVYILRNVYANGSLDFLRYLDGCDTYKLAFWGLYYILMMCEQKGIIKSERDINEEFIGYYLAPMVNSCKRMNGDMKKAFGVFFQNDHEGNAEYLYTMNKRRKELISQYMKDIWDNQPYAPYIYFTDADGGVLGLIAQSIMSRLGSSGPVFVGVKLPDGTISGSGRCPSWYPGVEMLKDKLTIAGHEGAFGWSASSEDALKEVFDILSKDVPAVRATVPAQEFDYVLTTIPAVKTAGNADFLVDFDLFHDYLDELDEYRPFGRAFELPTGYFLFNKHDIREVKLMGAAKEHVKIALHNDMEILLWNQSNKANILKEDRDFAVIGHISSSMYNDVETINFIGELEV